MEGILAGKECDLNPGSIQQFLNSVLTISKCSFYHRRDASADAQMPAGCLHINLATQEALQFQSLEV